jgi:hypothetical protein
MFSLRIGKFYPKQNKKFAVNSGKKFVATEQPENSYPRYSYSVKYLDKNDKENETFIFAFDDSLAEKQATSLISYMNGKVLKVKRRQELNWSGYSRPTKKIMKNTAIMSSGGVKWKPDQKKSQPK